MWKISLYLKKNKKMKKVRVTTRSTGVVMVGAQPKYENQTMLSAVMLRGAQLGFFNNYLPPWRCSTYCEQIMNNSYAAALLGLGYTRMLNFHIHVGHSGGRMAVEPRRLKIVGRHFSLLFSFLLLSSLLLPPSFLFFSLFVLSVNKHHSIIPLKNQHQFIFEFTSSIPRYKLSFFIFLWAWIEQIWFNCIYYDNVMSYTCFWDCLLLILKFWVRS